MEFLIRPKNKDNANNSSPGAKACRKTGGIELSNQFIYPFFIKSEKIANFSSGLPYTPEK
jgi:hypothetical protein